MSSALTQLLTPLESAQATLEGYFANTGDNPNLPQTLNNPFDITQSGSLLSYSDPNDSLTDFQNLISNMGTSSSPYSPTESLQDFENTYTGGNQNAGSVVANLLGNGITPQSTMQQVLASSNQATGVPSTPQSGTGQTSSTSNTGNNALSFLQQLFGYAVTGGQSTLVTSSYLVRAVGIIGGMILIAGAVWGFSNVKDTIVTTAKKGAEAAALTG